MILNEKILKDARKIIQLCSINKIRIATVESCTGGLISAYLTAIPGSSKVFDRGLTTYTNESKISLAGVPEKMIEKFGAVSKEVAISMANGGLSRSNANIAISVTGIAGPGGGTKNKPVGLVHFGLAKKDFNTLAFSQKFQGDRTNIRKASVLYSFNLIIKSLEE